MSFFKIAFEPTAAELADWVGGEVVSGDAEMRISGVAPLDRAGPSELAFLDNKQYLPQFEITKAGACLVLPKFAGRAPKSLTAITCDRPYVALADILARLYPGAVGRGQGWQASASGLSPSTHCHETAEIEDGANIEPGAAIGEGAKIGRGSFIGPNSSIGPGVTIGRGCHISPGVTIQCAHLGDRVTVHPGVCIGQDGFGFAMGPTGHKKVPQIGRVIIQNDVEIGSNTTIDRGALSDTVIGEGTKIDNLVQIAHNVQIGRHCVIVAQTGISGSTKLGDFVALGGQVGIVGHLEIGSGAQIAATSNVKDNVPAGEVWGGTPAKPIRQWFREVTALRKLAEQKSGSEK